MTTARTRRSPIDRQLEAYEESWKQDHDEAMHYWDFQENLAVGTAIFRAIDCVNVSWRQRVSLGLEGCSEEFANGLRKSFESWLQSCDEALARLAFFEKEYGSVQGAKEFRRCCERAKEIVRDWTAPVLSQAPGLHAAEFTEDETDKLDAILKEGEARPRLEPRPL